MPMLRARGDVTASASQAREQPPRDVAPRAAVLGRDLGRSWVAALLSKTSKAAIVSSATQRGGRVLLALLQSRWWFRRSR
jgi:hypothetical protein